MVHIDGASYCPTAPECPYWHTKPSSQLGTRSWCYAFATRCDCVLSKERRSSPSRSPFLTLGCLWCLLVHTSELLCWKLPLGRGFGSAASFPNRLWNWNQQYSSFGQTKRTVGWIVFFLKVPWGLFQPSGFSGNGLNLPKDGFGKILQYQKWMRNSLLRD